MSDERCLWNVNTVCGYITMTSNGLQDISIHRPLECFLTIYSGCGIYAHLTSHPSPFPPSQKTESFKSWYQLRRHRRHHRLSSLHWKLRVFMMPTLCHQWWHQWRMLATFATTLSTPGGVTVCLAAFAETQLRCRKRSCAQLVQQTQPAHPELQFEVL